MTFKIGILSDTHGLLRPEVLPALSDCRIILHAGDIGTPEILEQLGQTAPVHAVRGNMDKGVWAEALPVNYVVEIGGHCIYLLHDIEKMDLDPAAAKFAMVVFGHSHRAYQERQESVLYLNPGSAGPRRFALPATVATVTINDEGLSPEIINLNCL